MEYSYSTFRLAGNGSTPTTNKYHDFDVTLTCSVMDEKHNLQCLKLKISQQNVQKCVIFISSPKLTASSRVPINILWICGNVCMFNISLLVWRKICDQSLYNNLSIKSKWQKCVTQGVVSCHLESYRKSGSFVWILFTKRLGPKL